MSAKLSLSLAAALALSAAASGVARADPDEARASNVRSRSPTSEEIDSLEMGTPASVGYRNRKVDRAADWKGAWESLEAGNPHNAQPGGGAEPEQKK